MASATPDAPRSVLGHVAWGFKLFTISFLVLEIVYVVLGNLFLGLGGLKWVASRNPDAFTLDYGSLWTFWPGRARVRDLQITGQSDKVQWMLRVGKADLNVEIGDLLERRFHTTRVEGEGASFHLRMRVKPEDASHPRVKALPPVAGFADPPLVPIGAPKADPTDDDYSLWSIALEGVDVGLQEVWIQGYRFTGDVGVNGAFFLKPVRSIVMPSANFEVRSGDLALADRPALSGIAGSLRAKLDPFDPKGISWLGVLRTLSAQADLHAQVPSLSFLQHYLEKGPTLGEGTGTLDAQFGLDHGVFMPGTEARMVTDHARVSAKGFDVTAAVEASFRVTDPSRSEFVALVDHGALRFAGSDAPAAEVHGARLALEAPTNFIVPWKPGVYSLDLPSLRVSDLRRLQPIAPPGLRFGGGSALVQAELERTAGQGQGSVHADLWGAAARWKGLSLVGSFGADLEVQDFDIGERTGRIRGELGAGEVSLEGAGADLQDWWGRVYLDEMQARADKGLDLNAAARVRLRDVGPIVDVMAALDALPSWAKGIFTKERVAIDVDLQKQGKGIAFGVDARGGAQSVAGRLMRRGEDKRGAFLVKSKPLSAGIRLGPSDTEVMPQAGRDWLKEQLAELGGRAR